MTSNGGLFDSAPFRAHRHLPDWWRVRTVPAARTVAGGYGVGDPDTLQVEFDQRAAGWRVTRPGDSGPILLIDAATAATTVCPTPARLPVGDTIGRAVEDRGVRGPDRVVLGDAVDVLDGLPDQCVDFVFTSPPYFNARPGNGTWATYDAYLSFMADVFTRLRRVLVEGRFLVVNCAPVILPRPTRNQSSTRVPIPAHLTVAAEDAQFTWDDEITWVKPTGSGFATNRGRRFAADRKPLQYKAAPVTERLLVFRAGNPLRETNLARVPVEDVTRSRVPQGYERTDVWELPAVTDPQHPTPFPVALAERAIRYWSVAGDLVMDPFAGTGATGKAAARLDRRFLLVDNDPRWVARMDAELISQPVLF